MDFYKLEAEGANAPFLELIIRASDDAAARVKSRQFVKHFSAAGYDRFTLWDMRPGELLARRTCRYSVTRQADEVSEDYQDEKDVRHCVLI